MSTDWPAQIPSPLDPDAQTNWQFVKGLIDAASYDNVQVQVMVACWEVGARFAIAPETTRRVMHDMISTPEPVTLDWLKASVGFFSKDCAVQLSMNAAGIRFLALAAALVTTIGPYPGAQVLDIELKRTRLKLTEIPPLPRVKDLLVALVPRSERCNFTDIIFGYQQLVGGALGIKAPPPQSGRYSALPSIEEKRQEGLLSGTPSPEAIAGLIDVLRQVARLGDSTVIGATIRIGGSAPWILAFVEWCLGVSASIYVEGRREPVLEQEDAMFSVKAIISNRNNSAMEPLEAIIHHHHQIEDITQLLGPVDQKPLRFMVGIEGYANWLLHDLGFQRYKDSDFNTRVKVMLLEVLSHAVPQILSMRCGKFGRLSQNRSSVRWVRTISDPVEDFAVSPLPAMHTIAIACSKFLNLNKTTNFLTLREGETVSGLPLVLLHLQVLKDSCSCEDCCPSPSQLHVSREWCLQEAFFRSLAFLILDILAFSLLDHPTSLRLFTSRNRLRGDGIIDEVSAVLQSGTDEEIDDEEIDDEEIDDEEIDDEEIDGEEIDGEEIDGEGIYKERIEAIDILEWARSLVGHGDIDDEYRNLIMTSKRGQVIYPLLLETLRVESHGYLRLCVLPGTLRCDGLVYDIVSCPESDTTMREHHEHPDLSHFIEVTEPKDLLPTFEVLWSAETQDNEEIELYLMMRDSKRPSFRIKSDPLLLLSHLSDTLLLDECPHNRQAKLSQPDRFCRYTAPWHDHYDANNSTSSVDVVAMASSDMLRIFALSCTNEPRVLRGNACLDCCLRACRRVPSPIHVLIL
ncbi:hypothetical protein B0J13DRAFT_607239 [Dactylonectria estremocensis]|uniref:Uncharacterized protein n=1 Tax=Dactylonectria estremocensis TaxID=1079267 RepID=A0A9P9J1R9_9HYPO|nr:hypothetical protein B0J13DRAFT_607239 [Dactylonectria estremocensis]